MEHTNGHATSQQLINAIAAIDLDKEIERMEYREGLEPATARSAADMYRKFLYLSVKYGRGLTPSKLIDAAWHEHMSDSAKYMDDCTKLCGRMIHHDPKIVGEKMHQQFAYTRDLFQKEFGIDLLTLSDDDRTPTACGN